VLSVIYGMKIGVQDGFGWLPVASVATGIGLGVIFVRRQRQIDDPLIDLRLFETRAFSVSLATYLLATLVTFGAYVLLGQYFQLVLGLTPLAAGFWMLPWSACWVVGSFLSPALARRFRPAHVISGGLLVAAFGFLAAANVLSLGVAALVIASATYSLGMSPVFTLGTDMIIGAAPAERAGSAAAISETSSELGGALGIAILGSIGTAIYRGRMAQAAFGDLPAAARTAALDTLGGATAAAAQLPSGIGAAQLLETARGAFTHALQVTFGLCAAVSLATAVAVLVALRRVR
jgi:DHA2 family multidrug resistance protein-like MFS transporter